MKKDDIIMALNDLLFAAIIEAATIEMEEWEDDRMRPIESKVADGLRKLIQVIKEEPNE